MSVMQAEHEMKTLSLAKHVLGFWIATPVIAGAGLAIATHLSPGSNSGYEITAGMIGVIFGLATGWLVGLVAFLLHRGFLGWTVIYRAARDRVREGKRQAAEADTLGFQGYHEDTTVAPELLNDPWEGTNPYGCCMDNFDANGVVHHGSVDCQHPAVLAMLGESQHSS